MRMLKIVLIGLSSSLVLVGALLLSGCSDKVEESATLLAPVVKTMTIEELTDQPQWKLTGTIDARYASNLTFRVSGEITKRLVNSGDMVKADQLLFTLDPNDYQLALQVVTANIRATQAEIKNTQLDLGRFKKMLDRELISQQTVDQAESKLAILDAQLKSQQLQEDQARNQLDYTKLTSPGVGKILSVQAEQGEVVAPGTPIATIALSGSREVVVQVPENRLAQLPETGTVQIYGSDKTYPVALRERSAEANSQSRTWTARYQFKTDDPAIQTELDELSLGQTATVLFDSKESLIRVPNNALYEQGDFASLWQVKAGAVSRVPVKVKTLSERWAWVEGDFSQVTTVVTLGVHQLNEGQTVRESAE